MKNPSSGRVTVVVAVAASLAALVAVPASSVAAQPGGFIDVLDDAYYSVPVAALAERGVFDDTECEDGFCPDEPVDRRTMAVWIVRVLDDQDPHSLKESRFDDVDAAGFHAPFIERMAELRITQGCGDGSGFCPDEYVSRAEMAAFLVRAYELPDAPDPGFTDVADDAWYAVEVAKLAASGITMGCGDGNVFCPSQDTLRGQMAALLYRAEERKQLTPVELNHAMEGGGVVSVGSTHACGLRTDGTITCWGMQSERTDPPHGAFTALSAESVASCGLRTDRTIACWGWRADRETGPPEGEFLAVSVGNWHMCALRTDRTIACWGDSEFGETDAPDGTFLAVGAGFRHSCGLRTDQTITCWGLNEDGQAEAPAGSFLHVAAATHSSCALRTDQTIACWGRDPYGRLRAPAGMFTAVAGGRNHWCGLRTDQTVICWGDNSDNQLNAPKGSFLAVAAGTAKSCGLRTDRTIACWGSDWFGVTDAPSGRFGPG